MFRGGTNMGGMGGHMFLKNKRNSLATGQPNNNDDVYGLFSKKILNFE